MDISSIALQGLEQASAQLDAAASQIAGVGAASGGGAGVDTVSLSNEMVALMSAKEDFTANIASLKTAEQTENSVLDELA